MPYDRRIRRGQNGLLSISQFGIRLCQRHELSGTGYQGRLGSQLRRHCGKILRLPCIRGGSAKPYPLRWLQPHDAHQPLHGCGAGHRQPCRPCQGGEVRQDPGQDHRVTEWGCRLRPERLFLRCRRGTIDFRGALAGRISAAGKKTGAAAHRVRVQAGAGTAGPLGGTGQKLVYHPHGKAAPGAQGTVVCRGGAEHIRPGHGLGHEHGIVSPQRLSGLRAGAGAVF